MILENTFYTYFKLILEYANQTEIKYRIWLYNENIWYTKSTLKILKKYRFSRNFHLSAYSYISPSIIDRCRKWIAFSCIFFWFFPMSILFPFEILAFFLYSPPNRWQCDPITQFHFIYLWFIFCRIAFTLNTNCTIRWQGTICSYTAESRKKRRVTKNHIIISSANICDNILWAGRGE